MSEARPVDPSPDEGAPEGLRFEHFFREPDAASDAPQAAAMQQRQPVLDALRGLFGGAPAHVQLRLWCFMELATLPQGRLARDEVNRHFHMLWPEALESALKRLRDIGLLAWDPTAQDYHLPALAQQVHALLAPLGSPCASADDDEMAGLLAQVTGAQQLGLVNANQLRHLHAQLARLHDEFAEAIASGSEARLRAAQPRFDRALQLVDRAGQALTALIRAEHDDPRLEREARAIGQEQARLLAMASQFTRALQQADRQRVTLGSTGLTTSDVRTWLQAHPALHSLLGEALSQGVRPVLVSQHDLVDVAEGEFERDRPGAALTDGLPPPADAATGTLDTLSLPAELGQLMARLSDWQAPHQGAPEPHALSEAVLGGRFAQAAYRLQLLPLLGDAQARTLKGQTGDLARLPWLWQAEPQLTTTDDEAVARISTGQLTPHPHDTP